ncbi:MAG TPA: glycosyltransferase family 39 protein [Anaeromyxobacteraceae bacterium]|nr:glycosyltransferase family 39 protein [Anaeromyxobacteraceae bacterium]
MKRSVAAVERSGLAPDRRPVVTEPSPGPRVVGSQGAQPWGWWGVAILGALMVVGLWFRIRGLAAEGFSDDETHTWIISHNYLRLDFLADELEHPIATKGLVALALAFLPKHLPPELLTRLPNALLGALSVWAVAELGRSLFGRDTGLLAGALAACSTTFIGYQRIAREDVLLGLMLLVVLKATVEARAAWAEHRRDAARRWELVVAGAVGAMFAAKYYFFYFPIPVLAWLWTRREAGWRIPARRWALLVGVAFAAFGVLDFPVFSPRTWEYLWRWTHGDRIGDRATTESILFMGKLWSNLGLQYVKATPPWFFLVFAAVKFAVPTVLLGAAGLGIALWQRKPAHRIVLVWMAVFYVSFLITGAKYGRYFTSVAPALFLLAAHATVVLARAATRRLRFAVPGALRFSLHRFTFAGCAVLVAAGEASAAAAHAPHYRLFINALGGGDKNVTYFFPHCDLFDVGFREAMAAIAVRAEANAEVCSETEWPARFYADEAGRTDLVTSPIREERGCKTNAPCYVVVEPGRVHWHNEQALSQLAHRAPWHSEWVHGIEVARVYRLDPGESLFPPAVAAAGAPRAADRAAP